MTKNNVTPLVPTAVAMQAPLAVPQYGMRDLCEMAEAFARSGMFGLKDVHQALSLLLLAQAEGRHPALAIRDNHVINNKPTKKAEAMQRDFLAAGGKIKWHAYTDELVSATFWHADGGEVTVDWDDARVKKAQLTGNHVKYPRPMKRARVISEGVKTVYPAATSGMYTPEEARDIDERPMKDVTPPADPETNAEPADLDEAKSVARLGAQPFRDWWTSRRKWQNAPLMPYLDELQGLTQIADTDITGFDAPSHPLARASETGDADRATASPEPSGDGLDIPASLRREPKPETVEHDDEGGFELGTGEYVEGGR